MKKRAIFILTMITTALPIIADIIYPSQLKEGDKIAILAPSGPVKREFVDGAAEVLREQGFDPVVFPTVDMRNGQFSGTASERFSDLREAFLNPEYKAILCARGGYGMVHNLDSLAALPLRDNPKWVIGYSDISALHALLASKGIASIHASMARHIAKGADRPENVALFEILRDSFPSYSFPSDPRNHPGKADGKIMGGNLAVIQALINTPYNVIQPGTILFIEDIAEPIYKVERIMYQLRMMGILSSLKGLILGQFTGYEPGDNYDTIEEMLADVLKDYPDLPVAFNAPVGHVDFNLPLVISSHAELEVTPDMTTLTLSK